MNLPELGALEMARAIARRELTAERVASVLLERIEECDASIHAWEHVDRDATLREARRLDASTSLGALHGVPVGVKDILDTHDLPTAYGSTLYAGHRPPADAASVAMARAAGALVLGKTVTTEFATMVPARTVNPRRAGHTPGGSSSGSAAAVAAGMVPLAYGTQTVGSIIRPSAYCGVVGYKPTFGTLSRSGMKMAAESLDTVGVIARSVADAALLVGASAGRNDLDRVTEVERPVLGVCRSPNWPAMTADGMACFEHAVRRLAAAGATLKPADLPPAFDSLDAMHARILAFEIARSLAPEATRHRPVLDPALIALIDAGRLISAADYLSALASASALRQAFAAHATAFDALVTPSATGEAPAGLSNTGDTAMNRLWTALHGPSITVPAGLGAGGLPLGVQLVGAPGADPRVLGIAAWAQRVLR